MELQDVIRKKKEERLLKSVGMSIRTTPEISAWMVKNNVMPSKVFDKAIKRLMNKMEK